MGSDRIQLMIAGAEKAGTSSLKEYLGQHPQLVMHQQQEIMYFALDSQYQLGFAQARERYYGRGNGVLAAKNVAILYAPEAAARLREHNPAVAISVVLRNPVDRAYSAYWQSRRRGWETLQSFEEALEAEPTRLDASERNRRRFAYIDRGRYDLHLSRLLKEFPDRVQVHLMEDLEADTVGLCQELFAHAGVDPTFVPDVARHHNPGGAARSQRFAALLVRDTKIKRALRRVVPAPRLDSIRSTVDRFNSRSSRPPPIEPATRSALVDEFKASNEWVASLIDRDLSAWNT